MCVFPVLAGGGPDDGRPLRWWGKVCPRADFDSISYNDGTAMCLLDGQVAIVRPDMDGSGWVIIEKTNTRCSCPIADNGIVGYDAQGRLRRWVNGTTTVLFSRQFNNPVRPAFYANQMAFGGDNVLVIANRTGKQCAETINLGRLALGSIAIAPEAVYFTATDAFGKSRLYATVASKAGYRFRVVPEVKAAEQVCYGAERLFLVDKWGVTSWLCWDDGYLRRDGLISTCAAPYVLCGGDKGQMVFLTGYGGLNSVGLPPDGKG